MIMIQEYLYKNFFLPFETLLRVANGSHQGLFHKESLT